LAFPLSYVPFPHFLQVVKRLDVDGDGRLSVAELEHALAVDAPNLSREERRQMAARFDQNGDHVITTAELLSGFQAAEGINSAAMQRAEETFARIHAAIARAPTTPPNVFNSLSKNKGYMMWDDFEQLVRGFCPDLPHESVLLMWQVVDKNNDGGLTYDEFARQFVYARKPLLVPASPMPSTISEEYFHIIAGRLLHRLQVAGVQTMDLGERARETGFGKKGAGQGTLFLGGFGVASRRCIFAFTEVLAHSGS